MTEAWGFLENFPIHFAQNLRIFYATYKTFCKFLLLYLLNKFFLKTKRRFGGFEKLLYQTQKNLR